MNGVLAAAVVVVATLVATLPALLLWVLDRRPGGREWVTAVVAALWAGAAAAAIQVGGVQLPDGVDVVLVAALAAALPLLLTAIGRDGYDCPSDAMVVALAAAGGWMAGWVGGQSAVLVGGGETALAAAREASVWVAIWALVGMVIGLSSFLAPRWARALLAAVAVAVGLAAHGGWVASRPHLPPASAGGVAIATILAVATAALLAAFVMWLEGRRLAAELREEVQLGVLPRWAEEVFPLYWRRVRGAWWPERRERAVVSRLVSRLALRKQGLRRSRIEVGDIAWLEVVQLRSRLCRMIAPRGDDDDPVEARLRPAPDATAVAGTAAATDV